MRAAIRYARTVGTSNSAELTPKVLRRGTHRSQSLDYTLNHARRLAPVMGITRIANVTGLDSVGIPVVMVCRPNSRSVAVSQGKGIDLASARASGLMEAAELYHPETMTLPLRLATYEEIRYQHNVIEVEELPRRSDSRLHPNLRLLWCEGRDHCRALRAGRATRTHSVCARAPTSVALRARTNLQVRNLAKTETTLRCKDHSRRS